MRAVLVTVLMLFILAFSVTASEWTESNFDFTSRSFISSETTQGHWTDIGQTLTVEDGYNGQTLIADLDGDGTNEIITSTDSSSIDIFNSGLAQLATITYPNLKGTSMATFNVSDTRMILAIGYTGTPAVVNVSILNYTGSSLDVISSTNLGNLGNLGTSAFEDSAVKCRTDGFCYMTDSSGNNNRWRAAKINVSGLDVTDNTIIDYSTDQPRKMFGTFASILDYDNDGVEELLMVNDADNDGNVGYMIIDTSDMSIEFEKDDITSGNTYVNPIFQNLDGAGTAEIVFSYTNSNILTTKTYRSTGASYWTGFVYIDGTPTTRGSHVVCDRYESQFDVCASAVTSGGNVTVACYTYDGDHSLTKNITTTMPSSLGSVPYNLVCADMDGDGIHEIITAEEITDDNGDTLLTLGVNSSSNQISVGDVNADSELDLIFTSNARMQLLTSDYVNQPPQLDNTLNYGGYTGWYNGNVCNGTAITFQATESGDSVNYANDLSTDQERLATDCGGTGVVENGTYDLSNPTFSCVYDTAGAYLVTIYIQDTSNDLNFSQYNTQSIPVNVINGVAGVTCNVASDLVSTPDDAPVTIDDATEEEIDDMFNILLLGSPILKFLIAIAFIIGAIFATAQVTTNSFIVAFVGMLVMGAVTVFGLLSAWIMILFVISGVLLLVLKSTLFGQSE